MFASRQVDAAGGRSRCAVAGRLPRDGSGSVKRGFAACPQNFTPSAILNCFGHITTRGPSGYTGAAVETSATRGLRLIAGSALLTVPDDRSIPSA